MSLGCAGEPEGAPPPAPFSVEEPAPRPPEATIQRLTTSAYRRTIADLFGPGVVLPSIEPDVEQEGLLRIGAANAAISPRGVEQFEAAATAIAEQANADGALREGVCEPVAPDDAACAAAVLGPWGRRIWRRPLTSEELDVLVGLATGAGETLADFDAGVTMALAALLQSPYFLYRIELGDPDAPPTAEGGRPYGNWELASRLSYTLWDTTPDDALLDAAARGDLTDEAGLAAQVDRMLADPRAREGFRAFISELLTLHKLDALVKDPSIFPAMRADVGPSAREETLAAVEALVFDRDDDIRTWLTTRETVIDPTLAMLYEVPAPSLDGAAPTTLPASGPRAGLLGQISVLAQHAHAVSSSATRRGVFVREVLLCQQVPPPPANANTSIPEPSEDARTLRERVAVHLEDPACASCHQVTDPIGLGLEQFDGLGGYRTTENGATIDPSGDLDGVAFADGRALGEALASHPEFTACLAETLLAYAQGHRPDVDERATMDWMNQAFEADGYSLRALWRRIVMSKAFREAGPVEEVSP
jgi:hypothetical protein